MINLFNKLPLTIFLLLIFVAINKSNSQTIKVFDSDGKPLSLVHVAYKYLDSDLLKNLFTDNKGVCHIIKDDRNKVIYISHLGYIPINDTLRSNDDVSYRMKRAYIPLEQMVVTAQYKSSSSDKSIHKIKVINRDFIEAQAAVNLSDVLKVQNNIRLSQDNILGSSMSMQGITGQNIKILKDGVPIIGRLNGNIDISQINLNDIERIEIVEGPLSVSYGTDALAGTINLISKKTQKNKYNASFVSYYESVGQYNLNGSLGFKKGKSKINLLAGRNFFDGWTATDDFYFLPKSFPADSSRYKQWKPKEQIFGKISHAYSKEKTSIRLFAEHFNEKITNRGYPRSPYLESAFDDFYYTWRNDIGLDINKDIGTNNKFSLICALNDYKRIKNTYFKDLTNLEMEFTNNPSDQDTTKFNMWMSRGVLTSTKDSSNINYELGFDLKYEKAYGKRIEGFTKGQGDYAVFASSEINLFNDFLIRPGLRYTYNTVYNSPVVPSLNIKYDLPFKSNNWNSSIRGSYARGFRAPSLKELYFEFVDINHNIIGNDQLNAEKSDNYHLDFNLTRRNDSYINKLSVSSFYIDLYNMISLAQIDNANQYSYINIGRYRSIGLRINNDISMKNLNIAFGYAYIGRNNNVSGNETKSTYSYSPELNSSFIYNIKEINSRISLFYKYTGELPLLSTDENGDIVEGKIDDYQILDFTFSKFLKEKKLNLILGVKNIFNIQSVTSSNVSGGNVHSANTGNVPVGWGRTFFMSIKMNIDW